MYFINRMSIKKNHVVVYYQLGPRFLSDFKPKRNVSKIKEQLCLILNTNKIVHILLMNPND